MKPNPLSRVLATLCVGALLAANALAGGSLDPDRSIIHFVSVKNAAVAEVHHFKQLSGAIGDDGQVSVDIALDAVETLIPIRNERMRKMLFETARFPSARISTSVDTASLDALQAGQQMQLRLVLRLSLHGASKDLQADVTITRLDGGIEVTTAAPLVINAADFNLGGGIDALQAIARLASISTSVPVTARLVFAD